MLILFPGDSFEGREPDEAWKAEIEIAKECGHEVVFVDHDEIVAMHPRAALKYVPVMEDEVKPAIYRGWMMTSEQYEALYHEALNKGVKLITTPHQYKHAHELPGWYSVLEGTTPKSKWIPKGEFLTPKLGRPDTAFVEKIAATMVPCIVKDYVKSRKHEWFDACFIPADDPAKIHEVIQNFILRQEEDGDIQGGLVLREFVPLKPLGKHPKSGMPMSEEYRFFWLNGHAICLSEYWDEEAYEKVTVELPEPEGGWQEGMEREVTVPKTVGELPTFEELAELVRGVNSPFFTMDLAQTADGKWFIMEIGDGQVSGFPQLPRDAMKFYAALDGVMAHKHEKPRMPGLTMQELDRMGCAAEDCDHTSHGSEMHLNPRCHVGKPTWCVYDKGEIHVKCSECDQLVARIAVDPGDLTRH